MMMLVYILLFDNRWTIVNDKYVDGERPSYLYCSMVDRVGGKPSIDPPFDGRARIDHSTIGNQDLAHIKKIVS